MRLVALVKKFTHCVSGVFEAHGPGAGFIDQEFFQAVAMRYISAGY